SAVRDFPRAAERSFRGSFPARRCTVTPYRIGATGPAAHGTTAGAPPGSSDQDPGRWSPRRIVVPAEVQIVFAGARCRVDRSTAEQAGDHLGRLPRRHRVRGRRIAVRLLAAQSLAARFLATGAAV